MQKCIMSNEKKKGGHVKKLSEGTLYLGKKPVLLCLPLILFPPMLPPQQSGIFHNHKAQGTVHTMKFTTSSVFPSNFIFQLDLCGFKFEYN